MPVRTAMIEVNGTRLYCETRGEGPPLLFLHGFTLDCRMWRTQLDALADRFTTVAYDSRGFGRSAMPGAESYRHCDDAAALCEHLGLRDVVLVGHSIGAHHLLEMAFTRPDLVAGWIGLCTSGLGGIPFPPEVTRTFAAVNAAVRDAGVDAAKLAWSKCPWFDSARTLPGVLAELDTMRGDYTGWQWTHDNPVRNIDPPAASRLAELRVPALIITGALDLAYNSAVGDELCERIPVATRVTIADAGHMVNMERPEAVNAAVAAFAERLSQKRM